MNLILVNSQDGKVSLASEELIELSGSQALHVQSVLKSKVGERLRLGLKNYGTAEAEVAAVEPNRVVLKRLGPWREASRPTSPILVMALPRPKVFRRLLRHAVILGYKDIHFCHSYRVEKSYWSSPLLSDEGVNTEIDLGLELAQDVFTPKVTFHRYFKPFAEDTLSKWISSETLSICAHPYAKKWERGDKEISLLALGPEGGWIDFELKLFESLGVQILGFSQRILSCETALPFISGLIT